MIDLSHTIADGVVTYRGLPAPTICDFLSRDASRQHYEAGTEFHIGRIDMVANTGTYLDAPFHRFAGGDDIAALALGQLADLPGVRVSWQLGSGRAVDADVFAGLDVRGKAVLVQTGWSAHWGSERYFEGHPLLTAAAASALVDGGAALIGIDSLNIDDTSGGTRPVHTELLGAGIPIVEHLCALERLPAQFRFFAVPPKVRGMVLTVARAPSLAWF